MARNDSPLGVLKDFVWTYILVNFEILRGVYRWLVPMAPKNINGEVVLITGAGHGMGREMALRFARLGAKVVCVDVNPKANEETCDIIHSEKGNAYNYVCDVTDRAAVMRLAEEVRKVIGDVYILVNNAGIMPCKPVSLQTEQEIKLMMDVNVNANIWFIQAFLPAMIERNHGHFVAMSSMAGLMGLRNLVPYCGSKYAVRGIMEALATELRSDPRDTSGINFTTVFPYIVNTGLCHRPRIRFDKLMKMVEPGEAADIIVNAVLRNEIEITVPRDIYYVNRFFYRLIPVEAAATLNDFFDTGCDSHE